MSNCTFDVTQERFEDMSEADFDALIDAYIERMSTGQDEIPAEFFLDLLLERVTSKRQQEATDGERPGGRVGPEGWFGGAEQVAAGEGEEVAGDVWH